MKYNISIKQVYQATLKEIKRIESQIRPLAILLKELNEIKRDIEKKNPKFRKKTIARRPAQEVIREVLSSRRKFWTIEQIRERILDKYGYTYTYVTIWNIMRRFSTEKLAEEITKGSVKTYFVLKNA